MVYIKERMVVFEERIEKMDYEFKESIGFYKTKGERMLNGICKNFGLQKKILYLFILSIEEGKCYVQCIEYRIIVGSMLNLGKKLL